MISIFSRAALVAVPAFALASPAMAHMSFEVANSAPGATFKGVLMLPHGCDGAATDSVRVVMPEGFYNAKPMPKPGWTLETANTPYDTPFDNHGTQMTEGVGEIVWTGGPVEDGWYDEFVFQGSFGRELEPGDAVFTVIQGCGDAELEWTPAVTLAEGVVDDHHHHHHHDDDDGGDVATGGDVNAGDLTLSGAFTRATLPNAPVGGGYLTITNNGDEADRLVDAESPFSPDVQIHEMAVVDDVMQMRGLPEGLEIPAGESVTLRPGGLHLMFMQIAQPFVEGETVPVTLIFERAGEVEIELAVGAFGASGHDDHSSHEGH